MQPPFSRTTAGNTIYTHMDVCERVRVWLWLIFSIQQCSILYPHRNDACMHECNVQLQDEAHFVG